MQFPKLGSGKDILIQNCQEILNGHRKAVSTLSKAKCSLAKVPWSSDNGGIFSKHQATHWSVKKDNDQKTFCIRISFYHRKMFAKI